MVEQTDKDKALKTLSSAVYVTSQAIDDAV